MRRTSAPPPDGRCVKCSQPIPEWKRADASFCSVRCRNAAEKARYVAIHPDYRERQKKLQRQIRERWTYGRSFDDIHERMAFSKDRFKVARSLGFRSGLEVKNAEYFKENLFYDVPYEEFSLRYTVPARIAKYSPDFPLIHNGIIVETKGLFATSDRQKHILIKNEHPDLDVRFVFTNPNTRISKQSSTTYAAWCEKHGFKYAKGLVPSEWIDEPAETKRLTAMNVALGLHNPTTGENGNGSPASRKVAD